MRTLTTLACFLTLAAPAVAQDDALSVRIGELGIRPAIAELESIAAPTPGERFALGGLHFLGAAERALQLRYQHGISDEAMVLGELPFLRLPIPENPSPKPFDPAAVEQLFSNATADLGQAIAVLDTIGDDDEFGLMVNTADLWFDINANSVRDQGEGLADALMALQRFNDNTAPQITVRFDTADAKWLSAYAHLLSGFSEAVVSLHPTENLTEALADTVKLDAFGRPSPDYFVDDLDALAALVASLEVRPDPEHSRAAHGHLLAMIRDNRIFWNRVAAETDNTAEWIPNAQQDSALPLTFPPETAAVWGAVLTEAEEVLEGRRLIPHWRLGSGAGINLARFLQDPPELDVLGMIQGRTFLPYLERGPTLDGMAWARFERMVTGDAILFMVVLN